MIDILHRYTKGVLYHSETAQTIAEAVAEARQKSANLGGANLYGANLGGANLYEANLYGANLGGADLYGANLYGANLGGANLGGADLYGANLYGANLGGANLYGANLYGADLYGADLYGANLYGANLYGANLPSGYPIASLCFGGWGVTVTPTETSIGCERHPNEAWLNWSADAPEIAAMHLYATAWWTQHREAVCAVIRDVMGEGK